jgi:histidine kinase/DNA gyrase B/HSP90-like ATPase
MRRSIKKSVAIRSVFGVFGHCTIHRSKLRGGLSDLFGSQVPRSASRHNCYDRCWLTQRGFAVTRTNMAGRIHCFCNSRRRVVRSVLALVGNDRGDFDPTISGLGRLRTAHRPQTCPACTGTGIADEKLNSIFKPFVTTKSQGTGLGLSIAQTIVSTYGGRIWAENRTSRGAAFHFTLRLTKAAAA